MILNYSKIVGSKVITFDDGKVLGEVGDIIIEADTMEIAAVVLKNSIAPFSTTRIVANIDIIGIDRNIVVIKDESVITKLNDAPKAKKWIKEGFAGLKQKVITRSRSLIGYVSDYAINCDTFVISSILTQNLFVEKVVPAESIIEYKKKLIITKDEFEHIRISPAVSEIGS